MGELNYCLSCGNIINDCICENEYIDDLIEKEFRWEYQHEGCSHYGTRFKKVMPDYED